VSIGISICIILFLILGYILFIQYRQLHKLKEVVHSERSEKEEKIKELSQLQSEIDENITKDELTGLYTRKVFEERVSELLEQGENHKFLFAVVFIDVDKFRMLNIALGREKGDQIIKDLSARLYTSIRKLDMICRFEGDQFAILLTPLSKPDMTSYIVERLRSTIGEPFHLEENEVYITASMGIVIYPQDGDDVDSLLLHADEALQQAKQLGVNQFQFFSSEFHKNSCREIALVSGLHGNQIYDDFCVYYQPIWDTGTNAIYSIEAILFWQHPTYGLIEFADFMHLAETCGNLFEIGEWLINHAFLGFQELQPFLHQGQSLTLSVSARQLENPHFIYKFSQLLKKTRMDATRLAFDIPENTLFEKSHIMGKTLSMLKKMGVKLGINHFGSMHISWGMMSSLSISNIKFSKRLMRDVEANENVIKLVIALANTLGLQAIASGVVDENTVRILKSLGCQIMQGDVLGPSQKLEELVKGLQKTGAAV
jgi:diguanylate cyclase (GGDEF)-like protein